MSRRSSIIAGALAAAAVLAGPAAGRETWPRLFDPGFYFYSTDLTPVAVELASPKKLGGPEAAHLLIPRAYLLLAEGYRTADYAEIPEAIGTRQIQVALLASTRGPLSRYFATEDTDTEPSAPPLQERYIKASIHHVSAAADWDQPVKRRMAALSYVDEYEGLAHYQQGIANDYYFDSQATNGLLWIECFQEVNPRHLCTASLKIQENLRAEVAFVDFRAYGGMAFFHQRIRLFLKAMCDWGASTC